MDRNLRRLPPGWKENQTILKGYAQRLFWTRQCGSTLVHQRISLVVAFLGMSGAGQRGGVLASACSPSRGSGPSSHAIALDAVHNRIKSQTIHQRMTVAGIVPTAFLKLMHELEKPNRSQLTIQNLEAASSDFARRQRLCIHRICSSSHRNGLATRTLNSPARR